MIMKFTNEQLKNIWPEWEIVEELGHGSYGRVYKIVREENDLKTTAALKVINIPQSEDEIDDIQSEGLNIEQTRTRLQNMVDSFTKEIELMQSLKGTRNIVYIEDYKKLENPEKMEWTILIRMELLHPLNDYIKERHLEENDVIKLGCDICTALEICSMKNIIHRDIKTDNIFVSDLGEYKLGDFGVARRLENSTGVMSKRGTPMYMAPELVRGEKYNEQVDIYSLGIVLYKLLNKGYFPFINSENQIVNNEMMEDALRKRYSGEKMDNPSEASPEMSDVILHACEADPNYRYKTATEFHQDLMKVMAGAYQISPSRDKNEVSGLDETDGARRAPYAPEDYLEKTSKIYEFNPKQEKKRNLLGKILVAIILIAIIAVGGITVYNRMIKSEDSASTKENKTQDKDDNNEDETAEIEEESNDEEINEILLSAENYATEGNYSDALDVVQKGLIDFPNDKTLKEKEKEYSDEISRKEALEEAGELASSGDYEGAKNVILDCMNEHGSSDELDNAYDEYQLAYVNQIKEEAISNAEQLASEGDYLGAYDTIDEAEDKTEYDDELNDLKNEYEKLYVDIYLAEADVYIESRDFDMAESVMEEAQEVFPSNQDIKDKLDVIEDSRPKYFTDVCTPYEKSNYFEITNYFEMAGETYSHGFKMWYDGWALYNLKGEYSTLEFDVGHIDGTELDDCKVSFYLDESLSDIIELKSSSLPTHYIIDLKNAEQLKIQIDYAHWGCTYGFANVLIY